MIVPKHWAESRVQKIIDGKQVTLKRFGWSDSSEDEAKVMAEERVKEAIVKFEAGEKIRKIDHKVPYNGAEGLPIREEVISNHGDTVVTRNSYGALCINTPDVLFADVDYISEPSFKTSFAAFLTILIICLGLSLQFKSWLMIIVTLLVVLTFTSSLAKLFHKIISVSKGGFDKIALSPIRDFSKNNPHWNMHVYKTPLGYRILVTHKTFDPIAEETQNFFDLIKADRLYVQMCKNQKCFRARVSPKPWRIGLAHIKPRPGVWPIKKEKMPERHKWVEEYEKKSKDYASCTYLEHLGSGSSVKKAEDVKMLHDKYCQSDSNLPIA